MRKQKYGREIGAGKLSVWHGDGIKGGCYD